jgi:hypothetical protein
MNSLLFILKAPKYFSEFCKSLTAEKNMNLISCQQYIPLRVLITNANCSPNRQLVAKQFVSRRLFDAKIPLFVVLKMNLAEVIIALIAMPIRESITYHTSSYWFIVIKIFSGFCRLVLLLSSQQ